MGGAQQCPALWKTVLVEGRALWARFSYNLAIYCETSLLRAPSSWSTRPRCGGAAFFALLLAYLQKNILNMRFGIYRSY